MTRSDRRVTYKKPKTDQTETIQDEEMQDDTQSVDTIPASTKCNRNNPNLDNNKQDEIIYRKNRTYCSLNLKVSASIKGSEEMMTQTKEVLGILQVADDTEALAMYKMDNIINEQNSYEFNSNTILHKQSQFPSSSTNLGKYLHGGRPRSQGGIIYCKICIVHDGDTEDLLLDMDNKLRELGHRIFPQTIQHWDTKKCGFLQLFHPDGDMKRWREWFEKELKNKLKKTVLLGLTPGFLFDRQKRLNTPGKRSEGVRGVHVECLRTDELEITREVKRLLNSKAFNDIYGAPVRFCPLYHREQSAHHNEKVKQLIFQHGQGMQCLDQITIHGLSSLDYNMTMAKKKRTLRHLILSLTSNKDQGKPFHSIDKNYNKTGYILRFKMFYGQEALLCATHVGAYLVKNHGTTIMKEFSTDEQIRIKDTEWSEDNIPFSKDEKELSLMCENIEQLPWIDTSFIDEQPNTIDLLTKPNIMGIIDDDTVSTFENSITKTNKSKQKYSISPGKSVIIEVSMDSRVCTVEHSLHGLHNNMQDMKDMLSRLLPNGPPTAVVEENISADDTTSLAQPG